MYNAYILRGGKDLGFKEDYHPVEVDSSSSEIESDAGVCDEGVSA